MNRTATRSAVLTYLGLAAAFLGLALPVWAAVTLPAVFSDHMVLQCDMAVPVWGWAEPGEEITVEFAGQKKTAKADAKGKWMVKLAPMPASTNPRLLSVKSANHQSPIAIHDILVGEVWLCSGQSNMAMTVNRAKDFEKEQAAANLPHVRMFRESSGPAETPQEKCSGTWAVCSPETVGAFSATAYFFGRKLHQELNVPVGLINSSVGGTPIEAWTSRDVMADKPEFKPLFERWEKMQAAWDPQKAHAQYEKQLAVWKEAARKAKAAGKPVSRPPRKPEEPRLSTHRPANLFNGKIAPLVPLAIRGAIWYQGESNASTPEAARLYATQLPLMIKDWRARWGYDFPFAWVQLPNFKKPSDNPGALSAWAVMRESMLKSLSVPNTGMAITIDIGEADDIHPKNKQDVGQRLAMWALGKVYQKKIATSGPLPVRHETCGGEMTITFQHTDGGLVVKIGEALTTPRADSPTVWPEGLGGFGQVRGFAIAGADRKWHWAKAKIVGDTVVVAAPEVKQPVAVRYAWGDNPDCNLYNRAGLPASPFRTDDWPQGQ